MGPFPLLQRNHSRNCMGGEAGSWIDTGVVNSLALSLVGGAVPNGAGGVDTGIPSGSL